MKTEDLHSKKLTIHELTKELYSLSPKQFNMTDVQSCQGCFFKRCPDRVLKVFAYLILITALYITCFVTTNLSKPGGPIFALFVLVILALVAGLLLRIVRIPPMLGMLLVGIALSNIPKIKEWTSLDAQISSDLKTISLMIILMKGGLSLDIMDIKRVGFAVIRLAFLPCFVEATVFAIMSVLLLKLPWIWAFLLGFVIAAVTPAIIVPCLDELKKRKFKIEENNITTMLISASSFDDVVAISAYMVCLSSAFSSDKPLYLQIIQGPLEILIGIALGTLLGIVLWVIPPANSDKVDSRIRTALILVLGLCSVFGMSHLNFNGSGPLSVIVMSLTAIKGWGEDQLVTDVVDKLWILGEPLLFGLVGRDIQFEFITLDILWKSLIVIFVALFFRLGAAFAAVSWTSLTVKEKIFVSFSWIPKATVQAAIGSYALAVAVEKNADEIAVEYSRTIVTVAVLIILISAPLGSILMYFTAPLLLERIDTGHCQLAEGEEEEEDEQENDENV